MNAFWLAFGITFWAEMGDKSQLLALAYASRYRMRDVLLGIATGTALMLLLSVGIGRFIAIWIPFGYIQILSALCFFGFAIWTYQGDEAESSLRHSNRHPALLIGTAFFLSEFGDKTMFSTVTLATTMAWLPVWLGSTLGMVLADGLAVGLGLWLGKTIPRNVMKRIAIILFVSFGLWSSYQAWMSLS